MFTRDKREVWGWFRTSHLAQYLHSSHFFIDRYTEGRLAPWNVGLRCFHNRSMCTAAHGPSSAPAGGPEGLEFTWLTDECGKARAPPMQHDVKAGEEV